jgi:lipid-A-disaccharide synthase
LAAVNILIIAGEESGDLHGSALMKNMKNINSNLVFYGIGGDRMIAEGLKHSFHIKDMSFLGLIEVVKHLPHIFKVKKTIINVVRQNNIRTAILIDYPGFNLNLAHKLNKLGTKIFYYISPQIWAWGKGRIEKIKRLIKKMIVVFPFEKDFYLKNSIETEFVGHPLIDRINEYKYMSREELYNKFELEKGKEILLIMPGSRVHEIEKILPESLVAAKAIAKKNNMQIVIACSQNIDLTYYKNLLPGEIKIVKNYSYDLMRHSTFGIIKSGTSTLECALHELPFVAVYRTSKITYLIGETLVKIDWIAMPNIIAGEKIIEEFVQDDFTADKVEEFISSFLESKDEQIVMKEKFKKIKRLLGEGNASQNAARIITDEMDEIRKKD